MDVIFCGGRRFADEKPIQAILDVLDPYTVTIIHGGARGADALVDREARARGFDVLTYPADWGKHGRAAGPIRNEQMLRTNPDLVIAFPGGPGTADMCNKAWQAGLPILRYDEGHGWTR